MSRTRAPAAVERLEQPGVERPVEVRGERPAAGLGCRQSRVQPQREDHGLGRGGIADRPRPRHRAGASASLHPRATARRRYPSSRAAFQRRTAPSNAWAPGPTASYGRRCQYDEVVPALVPGPAPVRDLVAPVARRRPAGRPRARTGSAARSSSWSRTATSRQRRAPDGRGQVVAQRPGDALRIGIVERQRIGRDVVDAESDRRVERRRPGVDRLPRHVVQQVDRHRSARLPAPRRPRRRRPRAGAVARAAAAAPGSNDWAPSETRVTPAATSAAASPRSSGPGFDSIVTSAPSAMPHRVADEREDRGDGLRGQQRGRAAARGRRSRAAGAPRTPAARRRRRRASARRPSSVSSASTNASTRARGPARRRTRVDDEVAVRAQRDAERDVDVERDGRTRDRFRGARRRRDLDRDGLPRAEDPPALGRPVAALDLLVLGALRLRDAGVARREEDRDAGDRVADERRPDAARDHRQPAAGEADRDHRPPACTTAGRAPRGASPARTAAPGSGSRGSGSSGS